MKKRILSILLAVLMIAALLPTAALANTPSTPTVDGRTVYANGCPLIIEGSNNNARIYIDANSSGAADEGDTRFFLNGTMEEWGSEADSNAAGDDLTGYTFYGGYSYNTFEETNTDAVNTSITLTGGNINAIYGGSKCGTIEGSTSVKITGGSVNDVYGGSDNTLAHNGVTGKISIVMTDGTVANNLVGGGKDSAVEGDISILVTGGTVKGDIYGGGHLTTSPTTPYNAVQGNTAVVLGEESGNKQIEVKGNVFGGGKNASLGGSASVTLYSNSNKVSAANVFGGGCGVSALVTGDTTVKSGAVIRAKENGGTYTYGGVYGGGYYDINSSDYQSIIYPTVGGNAEVTITGGIMQDVKVSGVCRNTSGAELNAALTAGSGAISIQGGTIRRNVDAKTYVNDITGGSGDCTVTGGSIRGTITANNVTNGSGSVYRTEATLPGVTEEVLVDYSLALAFSNDLQNEHTYIIKGIYPDANGKLWFYLPDGITAVASYEGANLVANVSAAKNPNVFEQFIVDAAGNAIYANMNPIKLVTGTTEGNTNILYDADGDGEIKATELLKIGAVEPTEAGYDLKGYTVYLGFKDFAGTYSTALTVDGGVVKNVKLNGTDTNDVTQYGVKAVMNDGTILDTLDLGYCEEDTGVKTLTINGGSINLPGNIPAPADKNGNALYRTRLLLPNAANSHVAADKLTLKKGAGESASAVTYGMTELYAKADNAHGLLSFWLPADKDATSGAEVQTTYTATYDAEPVYTAYVKNGVAPYYFRQTSDALTVADARAVKADASVTSVTYTVTNDPVPTPITNGLKVYTYDETAAAYASCAAVTATLSGTTLTLTGTSGLAAGDYYVTVTVKDATETGKWESDYLKLSVADPVPEVVGTTLYINKSGNVKITADDKGTYACVDSNNNGNFEDSEYIMDSTDPAKKLNINGYDVDADGKTATVTAGTIGALTADTAVINGGSVKSITANTIRNAVGTALYKATITLSGVTSAKMITAIDVDGYDVTNTYTDNSGKLCFWLPEGTEVKRITASSVYAGTLTVLNDNTAAADFTRRITGGGGGGGGLTLPAIYNVVFDTNGGSAVSSVNVSADTAVTEPAAPTKEGFTFTGWYTDKECTQKYNFADPVKQTVTLYAGWKQNVSAEKQLVLTIDKKEAAAFGKEVANDVAPIIRNNRTMLPARFVAENLGATVEWDAIKHVVTITKDETTIVLTIGSDKATVNGKEVTLDSPAFIENNRTYTPIRFVAEALGATVEWNETARQVTITKQ